MPRNTIQIRLKRISTSVHSAGLLQHEAGDDLEHAQLAASASMAQAGHGSPCAQKSLFHGGLFHACVQTKKPAAAEAAGIKTAQGL
jgi:hypothetical protein